MYRTCLFCHADLGRNTVVEHLQVGRRLAFDSAKGRLWVVCRGCERWNLTPFDERWEATEECERLFSGTRLRFSTDEIGLARAGDGTELVRIGAPQRPEMAAWRYGDQFGRRRRRHMLLGATGVVVAGGIIVAPTLIGISIGSTVLYNGVNLTRWLVRMHRVELRVADAEGRLIGLTRMQIEQSLLSAKGSGTLRLEIPDRTKAVESDRAPAMTTILATQRPGFTSLEGPLAEGALQMILPRLNRRGATRAKVQEAVRILGETPDVAQLAMRAETSDYNWWDWNKKAGTLAILPAELRLALEMISHEEAERRWLAGELLELEAAWREAEELAAIADRLGLPEEIESRLAELKRTRGSELS